MHIKQRARHFVRKTNYRRIVIPLNDKRRLGTRRQKFELVRDGTAYPSAAKRINSQLSTYTRAITLLPRVPSCNTSHGGDVRDRIMFGDRRPNTKGRTVTYTKRYRFSCRLVVFVVVVLSGTRSARWLLKVFSRRSFTRVINRPATS